MSQGHRKSVLVTGAAGNIGSYFARHACSKYDLRLMVHNSNHARHVKSLCKLGKTVTGEIGDLASMSRLCAGIDTVLHLAGDPSPSATWDSLLQANIIGTYNTFVAAKSAGCRRVIYASSIHAVSGYPPDVQVKTTEPVNPGDMYGVTKCFGEAMARYMAEKEKLSCIVLRIAAFQPVAAARKRKAIAMADAWVSRRDLQQLIEKSIDAEDLSFAILHGISDNRFKRLDLTDTRRLVGYAPQDDFTQESPQLRALHLRKSISSHSVSDAPRTSGIRKDVARAKRTGGIPD